MRGDPIDGLGRLGLRVDARDCDHLNLDPLNQGRGG